MMPPALHSLLPSLPCSWRHSWRHAWPPARLALRLPTWLPLWLPLWLLTLWLLAAPVHPAHAQWLPVEPAAVAPLTPAEAALWPDEVAAGDAAPTRSLGLLLRLLQPKHDADEFALPVGNAAALRLRVADAVKQASPAAFGREADGRFAMLAVGGAIDKGVADALADTITTALLKAGLVLRHAPAERWSAETKGLLRALHDPQALDEARKLSAPNAALAGLAEVDAVRVVETSSQPASLWLAVRAAASRPRSLIARVNLDEVLSRVARRAP